MITPRKGTKRVDIVKKIFRGIGAGLAFESTIPLPLPARWYEDFVNRSYLFVVVGAVLGLLAGGIGWGCSHLPPSLGAAFYLASLYLWNGIIHPDGLADFLDGLSCGKEREGRLEVMKDGKTGPAGIVALVVVNVVLFAALGELFHSVPSRAVFYVLGSTEVLTKTSLLLPLSFGRSSHRGMGAQFIEATNWTYFAFGNLVVGICLYLLGGWFGLIPLSVSMVGAATFLALGTKFFGGVSGDTLGATHEVVRVFALISFVLLIHAGVPLLPWI